LLAPGGMKNILLTAVLVAFACVPAGAQPRAEMWAWGGDFGVFLPSEDALDSTVDLQGFAEYYLSPRTGIRMAVGWADPPFDGSDRTVRQVRLTFDVTHNWERGETHPFVGLGLGVFFLQPKSNGDDAGPSHNEPGANLFGGLEHFLADTTSLKAEVRYQIVGAEQTIDMHGLTLSVGLKAYF
jgi:hypothetical protein